MKEEAAEMNYRRGFLTYGTHSLPKSLENHFKRMELEEERLQLKADFIKTPAYQETRLVVEEYLKGHYTDIDSAFPSLHKYAIQLKPKTYTPAHSDDESETGT